MTTHIVTSGPAKPWIYSTFNFTVLQCSVNSMHCTKKFNRERDTNALLHYVTQNYHTLPDKVVFLHGHEHAWHQPGHFATKIHNSFTSRRQFVHLGIERVATQTWNNTGWCVNYYRPVLGACPVEVNTYRGMQFIASRSLFHTFSLDQWKELRKRAMFYENKNLPLNDGYMYEWIVHILLGQHARLWNREQCTRQILGFQKKCGRRSSFDYE
jgi:hypothetical protein